MATIPEAAGSAEQAVGYEYAAARVKPHKRKPGSARIWAAGALVVLMGLSAWAPGQFGWFGLGSTGGAAAGRFHVVKPANLAITLTEDGELKPCNSTVIKCEVEGQSTILFIVAESTRVAKGDLLVQLASDALVEKIEREEIDLRRIETELQAAREELDIQRNQNTSDVRKATIDLEIAVLEFRKYMEGDFPQRLKGVEIQIEQTKLELEQKKDQLEKNERLLEKEFVTRSKIEQLELEVTRSKLTLENYELAYSTLLEYEQPKNEMQKSSDVDRAREELERVRKRAESREKQAVAKVEQSDSVRKINETRLARMKEQLARTRIVAPVDGIVQYPQEGGGWRFNEEPLKVGSRVMEGQSLLVLPDTSQMMVSTRIHEADRHKVREGMPCLVKVPAVPGQTFSGTISKITKFADSANSWLNPELKEHATEILLDQTNAPLSPGDSAEIKVLVETIPDALAVPVQCVYTRGSRSFVFRQGLTGAELVEVKLGQANETLVQVSDGVSAGDQILMSADARLLAKLPAPGSSAQQDYVEAAAAAARKSVALAAQTPAVAAPASAPAGDAPAVVEASPAGEGAAKDAVASEPPANAASDDGVTQQ